MALVSIVADRDSAVFAKLCAMLPKGSGITLVDDTYYSDSREAATTTSRDPFFERK